MDDLPVEILSMIFSYLSAPEFLAVAEVSKKFCSVINTRSFLNKIWYKVSDCANFINSERRYVRLKFEQTHEEQLRKFLSLSSQQTKNNSSESHIKFDDIELDNDIILRDILGKFNYIMELEIEGIHVKSTSSLKSGIFLPNLKRLKFFYSTNSLLHLFIETDNQLEVIKVCLIPHDNDNDRAHSYQLLTHILKNNRRKLRKLNLYEVNFDDNFLEDISKMYFSELKTFAMSFNSYLGPESTGFENFFKKQGKTLEKFKIRTFDHIKVNQFKVIINHATNLKSLNLIICSFCDYENFPNLTNLHLLEKIKIQPTSYTNDLRYGKFIEDKILSHTHATMKIINIQCLGISSEIVNKIISSYPNAEIIKISSYCKTTSAYEEMLKEKLRKLKTLEIKNIFQNNRINKS